MREIREELDIGIAAPVGRPLMHFHSGGEDLSIWRVEQWTGQIRNAAPEEHDAVEWFTLDALHELDLASDAYRDAIARELRASGCRSS